MRLILILALSILCANASAEFKGYILSYDQLMGLPQDKRAEYIRQVTELMVDLEAKQLGYEKHFPRKSVAFNEKLRAIADLFQLPPLVEEASAEETWAAIVPPDKAGAASCKIPDKFPCESYDKKKLDEGLRRFRMSYPFNSCIAGGMFAQYKLDKQGHKIAGTCNVITSWDGKSCPRGQAACNPFLYGAVKHDPSSKAPMDFQMVCVPIWQKGKIDITHRCGQCPLNEGWERVSNPEDVVTLAKANGAAGSELGKKFLGEWESLRKNLADNYSERCLKPASEPFQAVFCQECKSMAVRIKEMNVGAINTACSGAAPPSNPASAGSSSSAQREVPKTNSKSSENPE